MWLGSPFTWVSPSARGCDRVAEKRLRRGAPGPETTADGSRGHGVRFAALGAALRHSGTVARTILALAVVGALLLIVTEFLTVASVDVASGSCQVIQDSNPELADRCELSGFERHGAALILLGLLAIAMAVGAGLGGSRPAAWALVTVAAIVLIVGLAIDLPETGRTGAIGRDFEGATAAAGPGLFTELIGAVLVGAAGVLRLLRREG
jgi:hypothetical protein